jgi:hypothetical protein
MLALGFGGGCVGVLVVPGVQPLLLAGPTCLCAGNKKTAITSVIAVFVYGLSNQGINTSIDPSAVMLTWLVPASTSGVTGAESMLAAFIIIGPRMYGCG